MPYAVDIDFDEASNAWRANKKTIGNGSFVYRCAHRSTNGRPCPNKLPRQDAVLCAYHQRQMMQSAGLRSR